MDLMDTPLSHLWQLDYVYTVGLHTHTTVGVGIGGHIICPQHVLQFIFIYNAGLKMVLQESSS